MKEPVISRPCRKRGNAPKRQPPRTVLAALLVAGLLCGAAGRARADLATYFGLSPRAIGLGNAASAVIDDYSAVYYNPAALAASPSSSFTLGYMYSAPRIKVRDRNGVEQLAFTNELKAGVVGYRQNLKDMFPANWGRNIVVGLALVFPGNMKTGTLVKTHRYDEMQFPVFGRIPDMLVMSGGLGVELHRTLLLGVGMRYAVTYSAKDMTVLLNVPEGENTFEKVDISAETEIQPIAGILFRPWEWLRFAAVWRRGGAPVSIVGRGGGMARIGPIQLPLSLDLNFQDFFTPDEFAGSVAWWPMDRLLLALEFTYARWSKYDDPFAQPPPGDPFQDILIPRFGVEYVVNKSFRLDAGYYWQPSPVKTVQPYTQYLDTDEHVFSFALEYSLAIPKLLQYPLRFSAYVQYQYMPERTLLTVNGPTSIWGYITALGGTVQLRF